MNCESIVQRLLAGNPNIYDDEARAMNEFVNQVLVKGYIDCYDVPVVFQIIKICNIIYNNAANKQSPLSDDAYDRLIVICKNQGLQYPVGAPPVQFHIVDSRDQRDYLEDYDRPKEVMCFVDTTLPYFKQLTYNQPRIAADFYRDTTLTGEFRKQRNTNYQSDLCGTLDKCKFVLSRDAQAVGAFEDPTVSIFERDFLYRHVSMGLVNPNDISLIVTLKYDGISVECAVEGNTITAAYTRGDTDNGEVADLTPIFQGMVFPRIPKNINKKWLIKAEAIITDNDLAEVCRLFNKQYANPRNAVIGLLGGLDARKYRDYITLVPLELKEVPNSPSEPTRIVSRSIEIEWANSAFSRGVDLRSIPIHGTYEQVLLELKSIVNTADSLRGFMGFQYDGVVVEYDSIELRQRLGKRKSIPNYAIAIKFPPMKRQSTFTHYTFSVGQTGVITPKAHFLPVYFMGQKHDKCTVHSLRKVNEFQLRAGDKVNLTYNNDVMVYLVPCPPEEQPQNNTNPIEYFPEVCPCCGTGLVVSESGDSAYCPNFNCAERMIARVANCLSKLNIKGFSTETIRALNVRYLADLYELPHDVIKGILGDVLGEKLIQALQTLLQTQYYDYRIFGSIGFTGCGNEVWKKIFRRAKVNEILIDDRTLLKNLESIPGIGPKTVDTIFRERPYLYKDLKFIIERMNIISSFNNSSNRGQIRFSGIRDEQLVDLFNEKGFDAGDGAVTKDTTILVVPMKGFMSSKVQKAIKLMNNKFSLIGPFRVTGYENMNAAIEYGITPWVMTIQEAYQFIEDYKG